jgi:hypothetical protein
VKKTMAGMVELLDITVGAEDVIGDYREYWQS